MGRSASTLAFAAGTTLLAVSLQVSAVYVAVTHFTQAVVGCQAALPAYDGLIRKRPKAVANEGTADAFVTCGPAHNPDRYDSIQRVNVQVANRNPTPVTITCTLVDGLHDFTWSPSLTKSITLGPNVRGILVWEYASDNGNELYTTPSFSCILPPRTEVNALSIRALDEVGN